jgi:soluble lytic murein transglycosylase-like protein
MRREALEGTAPDPGFAITGGSIHYREPDTRSFLPARYREALGLPGSTVADEAGKWPLDLQILSWLGLAPAATLPAGRARAAYAGSIGNYHEATLWGEGDAFLASPLAYWDLLEPAARAVGIDPLFYIALVRQESAFDTNSRSWVGALGLAQLMPFTADWVARQLGGTPKPLTDPAWNLRLGAWYLAYAGRSFDGNGILQTAAYNAGVGAARRWRGSLGSDPEAFIEGIPFKETRHYVKKVYGYYWTYMSLYRPYGSSVTAN